MAKISIFHYVRSILELCYNFQSTPVGSSVLYMDSNIALFKNPTAEQVIESPRTLMSALANSLCESFRSAEPRSDVTYVPVQIFISIFLIFYFRDFNHFEYR